MYIEYHRSDVALRGGFESTPRKRAPRGWARRPVLIVSRGAPRVVPGRIVVAPALYFPVPDGRSETLRR